MAFTSSAKGVLQKDPVFSFDDPVDYSQHSDPNVDTAVLSEDHPVDLLEKAKRIYEGRKPPFLAINRGSLPKPRSAVIPTVSGGRPQVPKSVELRAASWDKEAKSIYWILDLNNKRHIVKACGGAPNGGVRYLSWDGSDNGSKSFNQKPIAFSELNSAPFHDVPEVSEERPSREDGGNDRARAARNIFNRKQAQQIVAAITSDSESSYEPSNAVTSGKEGSKKRARGTRHSDLLPRPMSAVNKAATPKKRRRTETYLDELGPDLTSDSPPLQPRHKAQITNGDNFRSNPPSQSIHAHVQTPRPSPRLSFQETSQQSTDDSTILSDHKLRRTTLIVRIAPSPEFQPLKLSECRDVDAFFTKALDVWNLGESDVTKLTVHFTWLNAEDRMRTMVINRHQKASFLYLLEQVDDCPCWEDERGKCLLDVDIVPK